MARWTGLATVTVGAGRASWRGASPQPTRPANRAIAVSTCKGVCGCFAKVMGESEDGTDAGQPYLCSRNEDHKPAELMFWLDGARHESMMGFGKARNERTRHSVPKRVREGAGVFIPI